jgi:hypothetical protein
VSEVEGGCGGERQRLFADDMLAGGEGGGGQFIVLRRGGTDVDDVDVGLMEQEVVRLARSRWSAAPAMLPQPADRSLRRRSGLRSATATTWARGSLR